MLRWFLKTGGYTILLKVVAMMVTLLFVALLSQWMPKEDYGVLAMIISVATLAGALGGFGQTDLVIKETAPLISNRRYKEATLYQAEAVKLVMVTGFISSVFAGAFFLLDGYGVIIAASTFFIAFAWSLSHPLQGGARSYERFLLAIGPRDIFWRAGVLVLCGALVLNGSSTGIDVIAPLAAAVFIIVIATQIFALRLPAAELFSKPEALSDTARLVTSAALTISFSTIQTQNNVDTFFAGWVISPEAAAEYYPANRISLVAGLFYLPFQMLIATRIATMMAAGQIEDVKRINTISTIFLTIFCGITAIVLVLLYPLFSTAFGTVSEDTLVILTILLAAPTLNAWLGMPDLPLVMSGRLKALVIINLIALVLGTLGVYLAATSGSLIAVAAAASGAIIGRKLAAAILAILLMGIWPIHVSKILPSKTS